MKYKGTLITDASGSLNGVVFSHNTMGAYIRQRVTPTNRNTQAQQQIRGSMANAHAHWLGFPQATRDAWDAYAAGTPITDKLGNTVYLPGRLMFIRDYMLRVPRGLGLPPVVVHTMGLATLTVPTITVTSPVTGTIAFTPTDPWCAKTGGWLRAFVSIAKGTGINWFRGPYTGSVCVQGVTGAPPASPLAFTMPSAFAVGQKCFYRCIATDEEGRLSQEQFRVTVSV